METIVGLWIAGFICFIVFAWFIFVSSESAYDERLAARAFLTSPVWFIVILLLLYRLLVKIWKVADFPGLRKGTSR